MHIHTQQVHVFFRIKRKLAGLNIKKSTWPKNTPVMLSKIRTDFKVGLGVRYWGVSLDVMCLNPGDIQPRGILEMDPR